MKRIRALNGYTIYQATTQRDADNYHCQVGDYSIYLSSDVRDFGLSCSYPEWDGVDSLAVAVAMCNGSSYAVAVELAEELSDSTAQDMDLVLEIECRLDAGESLESVRDSYNTEEQCFTRDCLGDTFNPYEDHPSIGQYGIVIPDDCPIDEDLLDGDLEDVLDRALEAGDRADANLGHDPDETDLLIRAMRAADWSYDGLDRDGDICFGGPNCELVHFGSWPEVREWLEGVVFDDPEVPDRVERILHPERFSQEAGDRPDDEAALRDWELSAIETGNYLINDADEIVRVLVITRIDGELSFHCETRTGARIDVDAAQASRCKVVTDDSSWEDKRLAAGLWSGRPAGHATYYVVKSDGDYITATVNFGQACYESREEYQRRRARAFFRTVAERYAFSDCSDDHVLEIVYDGCRIEYAGWRPGMRYTFYEPTTGLVAYDESFPEWDH